VKFGAAFGSFGWSGEAVGDIKKALEAMKIDVVGELKTNYMPDDEMIAKCRALGEEIAARLAEL
jgi:flavorubredoxin